MTRSVARASGLQDAAERAPRHSVERLGDDQIVRITTRGFIVFEPDTVHGTIIAGFVGNQAKRFLVGEKYQSESANYYYKRFGAERPMDVGYSGKFGKQHRA